MSARLADSSASLATADPSCAAIGDRLLRWPAVRARTGLSRTTVWRLVRAGSFPSPVRLSANAIGWRASDVETWIASRVPTRAGAAHR